MKKIIYIAFMLAITSQSPIFTSVSNAPIANLQQNPLFAEEEPIQARLRKKPMQKTNRYAWIGRYLTCYKFKRNEFAARVIPEYHSVRERVSELFACSELYSDSLASVRDVSLYDQASSYRSAGIYHLDSKILQELDLDAARQFSSTPIESPTELKNSISIYKPISQVRFKFNDNDLVIGAYKNHRINRENSLLSMSDSE